MIIVSYDPAIVYGWLQGEETIGLDKQASLDRFEGKVRRELTRWAHVDCVRFEKKQGQGLVIGPPDDALDMMIAQVQCLFIDCHLLVYASPELHVQALRNTSYINLRLSLRTDLIEAYNIAPEKADLLTRQTRQQVYA